MTTCTKHNYESHLDSSDNTIFWECAKCGHQERYDDN